MNVAKSGNNNHSKHFSRKGVRAVRSRTFMAAAVSALAFVLALAFGAAPASAAAYAKGVYAPKVVGESIEGWADVNTDCADTFGCHTYVKIEYLDDNELRPSWYDGWSNAGGQWADDGWNKVVVDYQGCGDYRVTVDSYNDAPSDGVVGVSLGFVELNLGSGVQRYRQTSVSSTARICIMA